MTQLGGFFQLSAMKLSSTEDEPCVIKLDDLRVALYFAFRVRNVEIFGYNRLCGNNLRKVITELCFPTLDKNIR